MLHKIVFCKSEITPSVHRRKFNDSFSIVYQEAFLFGKLLNTTSLLWHPCQAWKNQIKCPLSIKIERKVKHQITMPLTWS